MNMLSSRCLRPAAARGARAFASHGGKAPHVHMPETAMLTANGTHKFERKGWEYSAYMAMLGAPVMLFLGLTNVPETDSEAFAKEEALAIRAGQDAHFERRPSSPNYTRFIFKHAEVGEPPALN